jgi:serine/threonine protein kinase
MIGRVLGSYRIVEQIGMGGMATVFKAYDANTDRYVALKLLPERLSANPDFRTRFHREAKAIARLEHIHILPVFAYGEEGQNAFLVMRFIQAGTLSERIAKGPLTLNEIDSLLKQIAGALDYAHQQGILHRDVKPKNILLDEYGNTYLTDFGIAKIVETTTDLTGDSILGTPKYMSPEQCRGGQKLTAATDIYSLGIVLFEMLTGRPPFDAETPIAVIHMQLNEPLPLPRSLVPDLPEAVERVVLKALAKAPEDRYQSAEAMARDFHLAVATAETEHISGAEGAAGVADETSLKLPETLYGSEAESTTGQQPAVGLPSEPGLGMEKRRAGGVSKWVWIGGGAAVVGLVLLIGAVAVFGPRGLSTNPPASSRTPAPASSTSAVSALAEPTETGQPLTPTPTVTNTNEDPRVRAAMADAWGYVRVLGGDHVVVGLSLGLSGGNSTSRNIAADEERAARLGIIEFGPIYGLPVTFVVEDSNCSAQGGTDAANTLTSNPNLVGVVGTSCSVSLRSAMAILDAAHVVFISPSATVDNLNADNLLTFNRDVYADSLNPRGNGAAADTSTEVYKAFASRFTNAFALPCCKPYAAEAYDATVILLSAISQVSTPDGSGGVIIPRMQLANAVRATRGFPGVSGPISFDDRGDLIVPP